MFRRMSAQDDTITGPNPYGVIEDKSLAVQADEDKDLDVQSGEDETAKDERPTGKTAKVKMLHHHEHDGEPLLPGEEYDLPRNKALSLVAAKRATKAG